MCRHNFFQEHSDGTCTDESETIWGSLNPVISLSRQRIYRNQKCALCNGVDDFVPLDKKLICPSLTNSGFRSFDALFIELRSNFNSSLCKIQFFLPEEAVNIDQRLVRCYPETISPYLNFDSSTSAENRTELCTNGPVLPYSSRSRWYRNIFCTFLENPPNTCQQLSDITGQFSNVDLTWSMVVLFGKSTSISGRSGVANTHYEEACITVNNTKVSFSVQFHF